MSISGRVGGLRFHSLKKRRANFQNEKMDWSIGGEYSYLLYNNPNCLLQRIILGYVILKINCP